MPAIAQVVLALVVLAAGPVGAQDASVREATVRVFIDCPDTPCDQEFFRTEIAWIDHVRDRQTADVHLLITGRSTGSGGRELTFSFFGQGRFAGRDVVLTETFLVASSDDAIRRGMARVMSLGLVPYVLGTDAAGRLRVTTEAAAPAALAAVQTVDPWHRWSLRVNVNGNASGERSSKSSQFNTNFNANRTTHVTKVNLNVRFNYRESKFELPDGRIFVAPNRDYGGNAQFVQAVGGHWSTGVRANWNSSTFNNQDWTWYAGPAIEWDLFPYSESTRRLLTFNYSVGVRAWDYERETVLGKLRETRTVQSLESTLSLRQRWGTIGATVETASFVPDVAKNHVTLFGNASVNLIRGLSLNVNTQVQSLRDQITLPRVAATAEEVLVNQRQLATSYRYFVFFGVSYTFGSIFSPIVNPRFGGA